jgi:Type II secretion system (T2SS), protein N
MSALRAFLLGIAAYGAFLLATIPASILARPVAEASAYGVTLSGAEGTAWRGSARVAIATRGIGFAVDEVRWRFLPLRLFAGKLAFAVEARAGTWQAQGEVARSPMSWRLTGFRAGGDASTLGALHPLAATWQPMGAISAEVPDFAWDGERMSGEATVEWRDAALAPSTARPLGSWRVVATGDGPAMKLSLATTKGPLRLAGNGTLALPGRFAFSGDARAEPGRERELEAVLALLGPRRADGAHALEVR